jgi:hypothetical protein
MPKATWKIPHRPSRQRMERLQTLTMAIVMGMARGTISLPLLREKTVTPHQETKIKSSFFEERPL